MQADGTPRELAVAAAASSFGDLCRRYAGDIPATALLKELRKVGAVGAGEGTKVRALQRVYFPSQFDSAKVLRAGSVIEDIGETVVYDLLCLNGQRLRFERRAENDRIDIRHVPVFQAMLEAEGQAFLERVDAWLSEHEARAAPPGHNPPRVLRLGVGLYHIQTAADRGHRE